MIPKILVIGDSILDVYQHLEYKKINPETGGSVYTLGEYQYFAGGAAAVAILCKSLGTEVRLASVIGSDCAGIDLKKLMFKHNIDGLVQSSSFKTTIKRRMILNDVIYPDRFDDNNEKALHDTLLIKEILGDINKFDIILISDYGKGIITERLLQLLPPKKYIIIVDPYIYRSWGEYQCATVIKANENEARQALLETRTVSHITDYARTLSDIYDRSVVITRGEVGIQWAQHNQTATTKQHSSGFVPAIQMQRDKVKDITGAGDVVLAVLGVYLAKGYTLKQACEVAVEYAAQEIQSIGIQPLKRIVEHAK